MRNYIRSQAKSHSEHRNCKETISPSECGTNLNCYDYHSKCTVDSLLYFLSMPLDIVAERESFVRRHDRHSSQALQLREAMLAAGSIHHLVSACTVFGDEWPSWGNAVLLEWMGRRSLSNVLAEVDPKSEEHRFVCRHIVGKNPAELKYHLTAVDGSQCLQGRWNSSWPSAR